MHHSWKLASPCLWAGSSLWLNTSAFLSVFQMFTDHSASAKDIWMSRKLLKSQGSKEYCLTILHFILQCHLDPVVCKLAKALCFNSWNNELFPLKFWHQAFSRLLLVNVPKVPKICNLICILAAQKRFGIRIFRKPFQSIQQVREASCSPKLFLQKHASKLELVWRTNSNSVGLLITPGMWSYREF